MPIGTAFFNMQLCFFASYIVLFIVGIFAFRSNLFNKISYKAGKRWFICGIALGLIIWLGVVIMVLKSGDTNSIEGGLTWQSAAYALWESFVAVSISVGLIAIFREKFNFQSKFIKILSDNAFAVYMFHPPIIVAIALMFKPLILPPIAKWLLLSVICVPLCFAATHYVFRRIPFLKKVL
jgi:peptidoglycan/LPS O-acetylase OafA/YrhL